MEQQSTTNGLLYVRLSDVARAAGVHPHVVERGLYEQVVRPDGYIRHGRRQLPIFLSSQLPRIVSIIRQGVKAYEHLEDRKAGRRLQKQR